MEKTPSGFQPAEYLIGLINFYKELPPFLEDLVGGDRTLAKSYLHSFNGLDLCLPYFSDTFSSVGRFIYRKYPIALRWG